MFVYFDIYIRVSLGGHNLGTVYARKLKFNQIAPCQDLNLHHSAHQMTFRGTRSNAFSRSMKAK